mmetsp:Transcript_4509/g.12703  ORF Transcript_4509/g.12703 Transcript_4509/m.12703 type:complete len:288 (+) Transcript_4509:2614-3477(+)
MNDKVTGINLELPPTGTANADALELITARNLAIDHGGPTLTVAVGNAQLVHLLPQLLVDVVEPAATAALDVEPIHATGRHSPAAVDGVEHLQRHALLPGRLGLALVLLGDLLLLLGGDPLQLFPGGGVGVPSHLLPAPSVAPLLVIGLEHGIDAPLPLFGRFVGLGLGTGRTAKARGGHHHGLRVDRVAPVDVLDDAVAYSGPRIERTVLPLAVGRTSPPVRLLPDGPLEVGQTLLFFGFRHGQGAGDGILLRHFFVAVAVVIVRIAVCGSRRSTPHYSISICIRRR